jgi:hypothetical protein
MEIYVQLTKHFTQPTMVYNPIRKPKQNPMPSSYPLLSSLYPDTALEHLCDASLTSFHMLVHQASLALDFEFATRALAIAKVDSMTTEEPTAYLAYNDGNGALVKLSREVLFGSFLSQLRSRPYGQAEQTYLQAAFAKSHAVDKRKFATSKVATPEQHTATAYFIHAVADKAPADLLRALIKLNVDPVLCKRSNIQINGIYSTLSPLVAAVLIDAPEIFSALIDKLADRGPDAGESALAKDHLELDRNGFPEAKRGLLESVTLYAAPEHFSTYLEQISRLAPIRDAQIDQMLAYHLKREVKSKNGDRIEVRKEWRRQCLNRDWDEGIVNLLLSRRGATAMAPELVRIAIENACAPVIAAAAETPGFDLHAAYKTSTNYWATPVHSLTNATFSNDRLRATLALVLEHGANINARNSDGHTPLILAACNASMDVIGVLLEAGADPELKDNRNWRALSHLKKAEDKHRFEQMLSSLKARKKIASLVHAVRGATPTQE